MPEFFVAKSSAPPSLSVQTVAQLFSRPAFASATANGAPSILLRVSDSRLAWANQAAARLFGVSDYDGLQRKIIGTAANRGIETLLRLTKSEAAPRLERLRFVGRGRLLNVTALCVGGQDGAGDALVALVFLGPEAEKAGEGVSWSREAAGVPLEPTAMMPTASARDDTALAPAEMSMAADQRVSDRDALEDNTDLTRSVERLRSAFGGSEIRRFAWRTDASGALVQIDGSITRQLGFPLGRDFDRTFAEQVAHFDPVAAERLQNALEEPSTWSGVDLLCPLLEGAVRVPLTLAASPQFDSGRRFLGFRGFGKLDLTGLQARMPVAPSPPAGTLAPSDTPSEAVPVLETVEPPMIETVQEEALRAPTDTSGSIPDAFPSENDASTEAFSSVGTSKPIERSANVVQLWPAHPAPPARTAYPGIKPAPLEDGLSASTGGTEGDPDETVDSDLRASIEAAVGRSLERKATLTSSEQLAFQEIGRTLGPGPRRSPEPVESETTAAQDAASGQEAREAGNELARHAAVLVETMTIGLLVLRHRKVLFANEALRDALKFENHSELVDGLTLHFARNAPSDEAQPEALTSLPSAYGYAVRFLGSSRVVAWDDKPAILWTLSEQGDASVPAASDAPVSNPATARPASDLPSVLDAVGEAIALVDGEGRILRLNHQAERYFGHESERARDESFLLLLASESRAAAKSLLDQLPPTPGPRAQLRGECVGRSTDGSSMALDMRVVRLEQGLAAIVWRDVSAQRELERELVQARRQAARVGEQKPDFLANVSHQIRTPLNAILGFAEIMIDERFGPLGNPRYKDYLRDMHLSGTQIIATIDDLMDLSRIESGKLDLHVGAIDINKVIGECVSDAHALAHRERIIVRTSFAARLPPVLADERSARQIIGNLLSNAIKFNEPGGQVIVSTASSEAATVVVRIRDTGIGMSDSDIASALEPFRQLAPTKNASGTGLGLPLTKALVSANGASLSMRSRPNEGTMVEIMFQATVPTLTRVPA